MKCLNSGVQVSYGAARRVLETLSVTDIFSPDLTLSAREPYLSRGVSSYDNVSVTMNFSVAGGGHFYTPLVKGCPFVTVVYSNSTPMISSGMEITEVRAIQPPNGIEGSIKLLTLGNYLKWLVYCSDPKDELTESASEFPGFLKTSGAISGIVRVASIPIGNENKSISSLLVGLRTFPTGVDVNLHYEKSTTKLIFSFNTATVPHSSVDPLLMLAVAHQLQLFEEVENSSPKVLQESSYGPIFSMKGVMRLVRGSKWVMTYDLVSVGWSYETSHVKFSFDELEKVSSALVEDLNGSQPQEDPDPYGFGKEVSRVANLALIANDIGHTDARLQSISMLRTMFSPWISGSNEDYLVYDDTWGGIVSSEGLQNSQADFGNGWYNDHHFQYGYMVYAGAVWGHLSKNLTQTELNFFQTLSDDICNQNPSNLFFPFVRHKDFYDGHSWASGLFQQANGKSQESSSEAVNAYYGCYLYGVATNNPSLAAFARTLLTMEIQAIQYYWHMADSHIYDPQFAANVMAGVVGALSAQASTWFGSAPEYVHGINLIPVTPVTSSLFSTSFAEKQWPILYNRLKTSGKSSVTASCSANAGMHKTCKFGYIRYHF